MINLIKKAFRTIGVDEAIAFTILSRVIQAGGGVITLIFIAKCLTKVEQGYYYTFGSILAIQVFFELGLSGIITQFVAHENSRLIWNNKTSFVGDEQSTSRLSSLLRFTIKWFGVITVLLFVGLLVSGYFFFGKYGKNDSSVDWQIPWMILSVTTSLSLMVSPILAFFEGLGRVKEVAKIRFFQQIVQLSLVLVLFLGGFKLYSSPIAAIIAFAIVPIWVLYSSNFKLLTFVWNKLGEWHINYRLEIFPYQWKIALSWISGYLMFQLFNPVLFATNGPVVAGQMGVSLVVLNGILTLSLSWINTKVPLFSNLIAKKEYIVLDGIYNKTMIQASTVSFICLCVFVFSVVILQALKIPIGSRFLPVTPTIALAIATFANQIISALATYLRCHKQEPFLVYSIVIAIVTALSTIILGNLYGVYGITIGYSIISATLGLVWASIIFKKKKKLWHL